MHATALSSPAASRVSFATLPPLALYVHIPWCARKCPYCDFNSHEARGEIPQDEYIAALIADLESALPALWGRRLRSIYFGGGTPSLLSANGVDQILAAIRARLSLDPDAEVTLEANPGTAEAGKFAGFRDAGINRLSIGVQSFNPQHLQTLGRIHDDRQARRAIEMARAVFENFNLDLMYALPRQTLQQAEADIREAIDFCPPHVSAYHLTIEPNTYFARYPPQLPDDDASAQMQFRVEECLASAGYEHYETSAFARPGRESRHNLNYWRFGDYLGIGAGAHSKLSFSDRIMRQMRHKHPREYLQAVARGNAVQQAQQIRPDELPFEFMMNALRLTGGAEAALFAERTGLALSVIVRELELARARGLLEPDPLRLRPTRMGQRFLNDLLQIFLKSQ